MKDICLKIDYRDKTITWWDWTERDKEETVYNLFTGEKALYSYYKIENSLFAIYKILMTDIWARGEVIQDVNHRIIFGDRFIMLLDEKIILNRSWWINDEYKVYKQDMETGELVQL